ncbi:MAG: caspase family protein [Acidobacteriota bacterium]
MGTKQKQTPHPLGYRSAGYRALACLVLGLGWLLAVPAETEARKKKKAAPELSADDLMIVDCLLPNKVRRLGRRNTHILPRRPIRTTAADCRIQGGEYTEPDQVNYRTSLEVWLPQAKAGDAEAQYYVGQIFEKGLGTTADYASAAEWYRKAAEQSYAAAQTSLGYLYEEGLGVTRDEVEALNWYRKAAGLAEDLVVLEASDYGELVAAREALNEKQREVEALEREVEALRSQLETSQSEAEEDAQRRTSLESILERLRADLAARQKELADGQERIARLEASQQEQPASDPAAGLPLDDIPFGDYHALVIGNSDYRSLPKLAGAARDARLVAEILEQKYGFTVRTLIDADRFQIMDSLNDLRESLTQEDNLLVYYTGHGLRDENGHTAYWQPVDAEPRNPANWIPNEVVTEHLDLMAARHVFVVADSVYSGLRTRSSIARLKRGMTPEQRHYHIKLLLEKRSRLVLASGGPGVGTAAERDSLFTSTFLDVLERNDDVLEASALYLAVNEKLVAAQEGSARPVEFATMRWARNDLAEFFLVPRG